MRKDDLMKSDIVSELVLAASGFTLFLPLLFLIVAVLHGSAPQP